VFSAKFQPNRSPSQGDEPYLTIWKAVINIDRRIEKLNQDLMNSEYFSFANLVRVPPHIQNRRTFLHAVRHASLLVKEPLSKEEEGQIHCQVTNQTQHIFKVHLSFKKEHLLVTHGKETTIILCKELVELAEHLIYWCSITDACEVMVARELPGPKILKDYDHFLQTKEAEPIQTREADMQLVETRIRGFLTSTVAQLTDLYHHPPEHSLYSASRQSRIAAQTAPKKNKNPNKGSSSSSYVFTSKK
jgi:hypothetical protein